MNGAQSLIPMMHGPFAKGFQTTTLTGGQRGLPS